jgi:hypothetical protein
MALLRSVDLMSLQLRLCLNWCATVKALQTLIATVLHVVYNSITTAAWPLGLRTVAAAQVYLYDIR